jgi:hypothetical protein
LARFGQIILTIGSDTDRTHAINVNNSVFTQLESVVLRPCTFVIHDELSHLRTDIRKWTACVGVTRSLHVWKSSSAPFADSQHSPAWWAKAHRVAKAGPVQYLHLVDPSRGSQRTVHHYHAAIDVKLKAFPQSHPPNARPLSGMPRPVSIAASFDPVASVRKVVPFVLPKQAWPPMAVLIKTRSGGIIFSLCACMFRSVGKYLKIVPSRRGSI